MDVRQKIKEMQSGEIIFIHEVGTMNSPYSIDLLPNGEYHLVFHTKESKHHELTGIHYAQFQRDIDSELFFMYNCVQDLLDLIELEKEVQVLAQKYEHDEISYHVYAIDNDYSDDFFNETDLLKACVLYYWYTTMYDEVRLSVDLWLDGDEVYEEMLEAYSSEEV